MNELDKILLSMKESFKNNDGVSYNTNSILLKKHLRKKENQVILNLGSLGEELRKRWLRGSSYGSTAGFDNWYRRVCDKFMEKYKE